MPNLVAAGLYNSPVTHPEETPAVRGMPSSSSLQLPTPSSLPWHRHTAWPRHGVFLAHPHTRLPSPDVVLSLLQLTEAVQEGRPVPFSPFPPVPGHCILRGTAQEVAEARLSGGHATLSISQEDLTPADHQAALTGLSLPRGTESSSDQTQRVKDLYPLVCTPKLSAGHSPLIGLQSLSLYLTNDNTVN